MGASNGGSELYLILHKVRGEPAFDIATRIGVDNDGEIWIIPTSGHRARPYQQIKLSEFALPELAIPDHWPDHYEVKPAPRPTKDLLKLLGLRRQPNLRFRPLA